MGELRSNLSTVKINERFEILFEYISFIHLQLHIYSFEEFARLEKLGEGNFSSTFTTVIKHTGEKVVCKEFKQKDKELTEADMYVSLCNY